MCKHGILCGQTSTRIRAREERENERERMVRETEDEHPNWFWESVALKVNAEKEICGSMLRVFCLNANVH